MIWRLCRRRKRVMNEGGGAKTWVHLYSVTNQSCDLRLPSYYFGVLVCRFVSVRGWTMRLWVSLISFLSFKIQWCLYHDLGCNCYPVIKANISLFMPQSFHFLYYKCNSTFSTFLRGVTEIIWKSAHKSMLEKRCKILYKDGAPGWHSG